MTLQRVVIVGGGATGFQTAEGLRHGGFDGEITLIEPERGLPYDRPPLSKQFLVGTWDEERVRLRDAATFEALGIEVIRAPAESLDLAARTVSLADGRAVQYDALVLATGATPVVPAGWPSSSRVMTFRRFDDSLQLGAHLRGGGSVGVIGAGMIGSEIASSARSMGCDVTLVDASSTPLAPLLGEECADRVMEAHRAAGVTLHTGASVEQIDQGPDGSVDQPVTVRVRRSDGNLEIVNVDLVVVAIGVRPATEWLNGSGLTIADGVVCDAGCRAATDVYAAGDLAKVRHGFFGADMRFEQRTMTTEHARIVTDRILGGGAELEAVPYYWSDQHHKRLQGCGVVASEAAEVTTVRLDDATASLFMEDGVVRGAAVYAGPKIFPRLLKAVKAGRSGADVRAELRDAFASSSA